MKRALLAIGFALAVPALACEVPADFKAQGRVESKDLVLAYRTVPAPIAVGKHFAVDTVVCARGGAGASGLRVDAQMPEHRHGMNYRATVKPQGDGRFRADGLLFHMPGRWQFVFDVETGTRRERLTHDYMLE
jgi:hypothetical protein